jgi:vancomycin resistance protein YoaR
MIKKINIRIANKTLTRSYSELGVSFNYNKTIHNAYSIGRTGSFFDRILQIYFISNISVSLPLKKEIDNYTLNNSISLIYEEFSKEKKNVSYSIDNDNLVLYTGQTAIKMEREEVYNKLVYAINKNNNSISIDLVIDKPDNFSIDSILKNINIDKSDAIINVKDNKIIITPHITGVNIDRTRLETIINDIDIGENQYLNIPIEIDIPDITYEKAQKMVLRDELSTYKTRFSTSTQVGINRGNNIRISFSKIADMILAPGEVFSFNDIVGTRTKEKGYALAHGYVSGDIVDSYGGGICQVSTTLYNTALISGLEIIERYPHSFGVNYAPYGLDATVSYGSKDFKFRNNTSWPLKIIGEVKENSISISFIGTYDKTENIKYKYISDVVEKIPFTKNTVYTDTLLKGTTHLYHTGKNGYVADVYKITYLDNKEISRKLVYTNKYKVYNETLYIGTKEP